MGREDRLWMGSYSDGQPSLGYYTCQNGPCSQGTDYTTQQYPVEKGREYGVNASVDQSGSLHFRAVENSSATAPNFGPISNFRFYLFSEPKRNFHVTVDNVWVTYDNT
jgi:hypothetical protein